MDSEVARMLADARVEGRANTILLQYLYTQVAITKADPDSFVRAAAKQIADAIDGVAMPGFAGYDPDMVKHGVLSQIERFFGSLAPVVRAARDGEA